MWSRKSEIRSLRKFFWTASVLFLSYLQYHPTNTLRRAEQSSHTMVETHIPTLEADQTPLIQSVLRYPPTTPHLNRFNLVIRNDAVRGRSIFASAALAANTLIEISPVLLFPPAEYSLHGSKTQLDGYTFVWKRTEGGGAVMALCARVGVVVQPFEESKCQVVVGLRNSKYKVYDGEGGGGGGGADD